MTLKKYTYKSENTVTTPFNTKKIITFIITLKSIPAKLTRFPNIHIILFNTKNNFKRNNLNIKNPSYTNNKHKKPLYKQFS